MAYSHNNVNEYTDIGGNTISHDTAGNLSTDKDSYTYHYDHDNRLTNIKKTNDTVNVATYTYDALGRRIEKIDHVGSSTTRYYYDGWRVLSETDAAATPNHLRDYVYGNYLDEVLVKVESSADIYYAHDHLFSPVALLDSSGSVVERYEYDVYGKVAIMDASYASRTSSSYNNAILFTGQRLDTLDNGNLPIEYLKNRYKKDGRFLQRDPLGVQITLFKFHQTGGILNPRNLDFGRQYTDGLNLYQYVKSRPVLLSDAYGLQDPGKRNRACCDGQIFDKRTHCCERPCDRYSNKRFVLKKVPIWICRRSLNDPNNFSFGPASHSFVVCEDPKKNPKTRKKFGKQPRSDGEEGSWWKGPGFIGIEPFSDFTNCKKKMVCPSKKFRMCQTGPTKDPYNIFTNNCHRWATGGSQ